MKKLILAGIAAIAMWSCSNSNGWTVKGIVNNASDGDKLALFGFNASAGSWYLIDSIDISSKGAFSYTATQPSPYSDVYSIGYKGKNIFFPIDSVETINITTDASHFDKDFDISGSDLAQAMRTVDQLIQQSADRNGADGVRTDSLLKRQLTQTVIDDGNGLIAYYIISKLVDGHPIFDVNDRKDIRTIGAVANNFMINRPNDPRTAFLEKLYIDHRPYNAGSGKSVEAQQVALFDINLYDAKGMSHSLIEEAAQGNVIVLSFVNYGVDITTPYNIKLHEAYDSLKDKGLTIYQVSVGDNEMVWKQSARNLPWISVFNPSTSSDVLVKYNVQAVPTTYIINRQGELADRVTDINKISSVIAKYL